MLPFEVPVGIVERTALVLLTPSSKLFHTHHWSTVFLFVVEVRIVEGTTSILLTPIAEALRLWYRPTIGKKETRFR